MSNAVASTYTIESSYGITDIPRRDVVIALIGLVTQSANFLKKIETHFLRLVFPHLGCFADDA